jgi:hypothetical protein
MIIHLFTCDHVCPHLTSLQIEVLLLLSPKTHTITQNHNLFQDSESAIAVVVDSAPVGVTVLCPSDMATYDVYECIIQVARGTNMKVDISYTDGNPGALKTDSFEISGI